MVVKIDAIATTFTYGTALNDVMEASYLQGDLLIGLAGNDTITGEIGNDQLWGNDGNDTIFGMAGNDMLDGGAGNDILYGGDGQDQVLGDVGDDVLYGGAGNDYIADVAGANKLFGEAGDDTLLGGNNSDNLDGGDGNDNLAGSFGNDKLYGGAGNDVLKPEDSFDLGGKDYVDGGTGIDTIDYSSLLYYVNNGTAWGGVTVNLGITNQQNTGKGGGYDTIINVENLVGTAGNDVLTGSSGDNVINGMDSNDSINGAGGSDTLSGDRGNDTINGGAGNDRLFGNDGNDILTGGLGADAFHLEFGYSRVGAKIPAGVDTITDFNSAQGDHFEMFRAVNFLGNAAFTATGVSEVRVDTSGATQTVSYDINGDGRMDTYVTLTNGSALTAVDFVI
jgi:Ca2+-binding RTX toxin-like protein